MELIKVENGEYGLVKDAVNTIVAIENEMKKLKEMQDNYKEELLNAMEQNNIIKLETDELVITYVAPTDRETFDSKAFKAEHQDLYDEYVKMSSVKSSVRLKVK